MLSETVESNIGSVYLTRTGLTGGGIVRALWTDYAEGRAGQLARTAVPTIDAVIVQEFSRQQYARPVTIKLPWCPIVLFDALWAQYLTPATYYAASLAVKTEASPVTFTRLRWLGLDAPTERVGSYTTVRDVTLRLVSVAAT